MASLAAVCLAHTSPPYERGTVVLVSAGAHTTRGRADHGWGINTGVTAYRDSPATRQFLSDWKAIMLDPASLEDHFDDQRSFTVALVERSPSFKNGAVFERHPDDPHAIYAGSSNELVVRTWCLALSWS
jgi:hypothetical protein